VKGLCFLDTETVLDTEKSTFQVMAEGVDIPLIDQGLKGLRGYEIHVGRTPVTSGLFRIRRGGEGQVIPDGASNGDVWGTYIHGIFDNDSLRRSLINGLRIRKGFEPLETVIDYSALRDKALDRWADVLRENVDMEFIKRLVS
ncbi:MAG TPA: cobyric acid synthase CobQ, partial [Nitrospirae bacterium]|nr:cobyric acid synthase CobQ [Nitrospirota bacterium]